MLCTSTMLPLFSFPDPQTLSWALPLWGLNMKTMTAWITTQGTNSPQAPSEIFFSFFSYLFKHFNSACNVSENGSDVIICNDTSLPQPVIPSWLRWRYWFGWDYMQINHDIGRSVVFQSASVGDFPLVIVSPAHMVWLQHLYRLVTVY